MFTSIDKAIVAVIMGAMYLASELGGFSFGFTEAQVQSVVAIFTPILVWLVPNKTA